MGLLFSWVIFGIISFLIVKIYDKKHKDKYKQPILNTKTNINPKEAKEPDEKEFDEFKNKYQKRYLLTKNEYHEYKKLRHYATQSELLVMPKVRLLDLIEPRRGDPKQKTYLYKIQSKHVDFVICDQDLYVKAIVEIDDNSHNQLERKERDKFIDMILTDVGYKVIRTRSVTETTLDPITKNTPVDL